MSLSLSAGYTDSKTDSSSDRLLQCLERSRRQDSQRAQFVKIQERVGELSIGIMASERHMDDKKIGEITRILLVRMLETIYTNLNTVLVCDEGRSLLTALRLSLIGVQNIPELKFYLDAIYPKPRVSSPDENSLR